MPPMTTKQEALHRCTYDCEMRFRRTCSCAVMLLLLPLPPELCWALTSITVNAAAVERGSLSAEEITTRRNSSRGRNLPGSGSPWPGRSRECTTSSV
jgi:hypothetical protein